MATLHDVDVFVSGVDGHVTPNGRGPVYLKEQVEKSLGRHASVVLFYFRYLSSILVFHIAR